MHWLDQLRSGVLACLLLGGCATQRPFPAAATAVPAAAEHPLQPGERIHITTYGEPTLTGDFALGAAGELSFPLVGTVPAAGKTPRELGALLARALGDGFLQNPSVVVEVLNYRPYYVLGEVNQPGEFPYQPGLTVLAAIARAEGFTYRARHRTVFIKRAGEAREVEVPLTSDLTISPGDVVRVGERYF
jgi:polysaccharide export outer membrane protein